MLWSTEARQIFLKCNAAIVRYDWNRSRFMATFAFFGVSSHGVGDRGRHGKCGSRKAAIVSGNNQPKYFFETSHWAIQEEEKGNFAVESFHLRMSV